MFSTHLHHRCYNNDEVDPVPPVAQVRVIMFDEALCDDLKEAFYDEEPGKNVLKLFNKPVAGESPMNLLHFRVVLNRIHKRVEHN